MRVSSAPTIRKCDHGVYWPEGDEKALSCQQCNPDGTGTGKAPVLPHRTNAAEYQPEGRETCGFCGNLRTYATDACRVCHTPFPAGVGRQATTANATRAGVCPACGSNVHYETKKKSQWECSDCGKMYQAPKGIK
jgi:ribosomal protein L37AE/L43A